MVRSKRNYVGILNKTCDRRFNTDERAELGYGRMSMERENSVRADIWADRQDILRKTVPISATIGYSRIQMGTAIVLVAILFVFLVRDVQLLAAAPRGRFLMWSSLYGTLNAIYLTSVTAILASAGASSPLRMIHTSPFWLVSIGWHCLIWLFCMGLNRSGRSNLCWLAALFPTPVLLVSMATGTLLLSHSTASIGTVALSLVVALGWCSAVVFAVSRIQAVATAAEARYAIDFAGVANTMALILVPISGNVPGF